VRPFRSPAGREGNECWKARIKRDRSPSFMALMIFVVGA